MLQKVKSFHKNFERNMSKVQKQVQKKEQLMDQNYANNTLFMTLSDIEAIEQKYLHEKPQPKQFGMYDPIYYSHREVGVLKEQLRLKLYLVKSSIECFNRDYGKGAYQLPKEFNQTAVINKLLSFQHTFQAYQDEDSYQMCQDLKNMLLGKASNFSFEHKKFQTAPAVSQQQNMLGLVTAGTKMRKEGKEFEKKYNQNMEAKDLGFKQNKDYKSRPVPQKKQIKYSNGTYLGETLDGVAHGAGEFRYTNGDGVLHGNWVNGQPHGQYLFTNSQGQKFKRTYENEKRTREYPLKNEEKQEEQTQMAAENMSQSQSQDQSMDQGVRQNQKQSQLNQKQKKTQNQKPIIKKITSKNTGGIYEGETINDVPHGKGKYWDGTGVLVGVWVNGNLHGDYQFTNPLGQVYKQTYENNSLNSSVSFQIPQPQSPLTNPLQSQSHPQPQPHPQVQPNQSINYHDGTYQGWILKNAPHGYSKFTNSNGIATGTWVNGVPNGEFFFMDKQGHVERRYFKNGQLVSAFCRPGDQKMIGFK